MHILQHGPDFWDAAPAHAESWYKTGPYGDSLDDIAAFNRAGVDLRETCRAGSFAFLLENDGRASWIYVNPDNPDTMKAIGALVDAWESGDLVDDDDLLEAFDRLKSAYWKHLPLGNRIDLLTERDFPLEWATTDRLPPYLEETIGDIIERAHPHYGC